MTFGDTKELVAEWLQVEELRAKIPFLIQQGQLLLERKLRLKAMEQYPANGTLSAGANSIAVPSGFIELIYFSILDGTTRHTIFNRHSTRSFVDAERSHKGDTTNTGRPLAFARFGSNFVFDRYADQAYTYEWAYFAQLTALSAETDTNWWTTDAVDALLYATLVRAIPVLPKIETKRGMMSDPRGAEWARELNLILGDLQANHNRETLGGTDRRVRYVD